MRHDFADGKYTVINDNGRLTALRHGEPWGRDLVGDTLVYWMLCEVDDLRAQRDALLEALKPMIDLAEFWINHRQERRVSEEQYNVWIALGHESSAMLKARAAIKAVEENT